MWRRGSVIASWLLDLTATALSEDFHARQVFRRVSDLGEGRWTIKAAIDEGVPVPVLSTALYERFFSRGEADYQNKPLSAMRSSSAAIWKSRLASQTTHSAPAASEVMAVGLRRDLRAPGVQNEDRC